MAFAFVIAILLVVFVLGPIARALAKRLEPGAGPAAFPGGPQEVARLRDEVDRLGVEVARLTEEQAFVLKLLAPGEEAPGSPATATPSPGPSPQGGGENGGTPPPPPPPA
ncbi:MAG TPA: hypothetical protein VHG51_00895 [Longimicrobiaceae bacterium]|nr:hypothetical protein [Longimicrobiaceae bacterium]